VRTALSSRGIEYDVEDAVRCVFEIRGDRAVWIVEGGATGSESFLIEELTLKNIVSGWTACAGTRGRWDRLFIDEENMTALVAWVRGKVITF